MRATSHVDGYLFAGVDFRARETGSQHRLPGRRSIVRTVGLNHDHAGSAFPVTLLHTSSDPSPYASLSVSLPFSRFSVHACVSTVCFDRKGDALRTRGLEIHSSGVIQDGAEHQFSVSK